MNEELEYNTVISIGKIVSTSNYKLLNQFI
jgi:hypothetical protein